jgi:hypothetical protein
MHRRQELRELIAKKKAELLQQAAAKKSTETLFLVERIGG